ncbi:MAG: hypothetical protein ACRDKI_01920 [Solirubrobacterales bacterium]
MDLLEVDGDATEGFDRGSGNLPAGCGAGECPQTHLLQRPAGHDAGAGLALQRSGKHGRIDFYACRLGGRAVLHLLRTPLTSEETDRVVEAAIAGDFVALRGTWQTGVERGNLAEVFDLRARRHSHFEPPDGEDFDAIWLTANGSLVVDVIVDSAHRLDAYDGAGRTTLESGPFEDPATGKMRAYWQTPSGPKTALLTGFPAATAKSF